MRPTLTSLALLFTLTLASACGADPHPKFADPTATPSTSSTSTAPAAPTHSTPTTPDLTPTQTVRAWVKAQNIGLRTGRVGGIRALSSPGCKTCKGTLRSIRQVYAAGGAFYTQGIEIVRTRPDPDDKSGNTVDVAVILSAGSTVARQGAPPTHYSRQREIDRYLIEQLDGHRVVAEIVTL